ncbi:siphovirus ReqiPepy6 Gp37-like family protein [Candidatus Allofournierella merdipullorum]|uniref:siphovirus ReqiPepy6 Gp37-like family protein n=1 Tax=Candidatus Allofournierella merdipullorum TaxID=2838595 RepID=UPI002A8FA066|nr:siphovirus ReqiPepy6 Gp37-like family protein [Candidatus Fournierella merdipullorum]
MQLLALDAGFQPVAYLPYFNLQWTREYYQPGQFSVQIAAADFQPSMAYLYTPDRPETGIIQKVALTETVKGRFVQLSGYFLEANLNDKVVWPTCYATGPIPSAVVAMLRQYKDDIPLLTVADAPAVQTDETSWQETGGQLADVAYTRLRAVQYSLRCRYDYQANIITAEVWQGMDRTQEQTANPFVTFSDGFGNLVQVDASMDRSNYKNYAVVVGQDQAEKRKVAYADLSGGGYKRVLYVDARSERWDPGKQTETEYLASLQQKGLDALLDYAVIHNVDIQAAAGGFVYREDWDLGDLVDVIVAEIGMAMQARIVTVREVFKQNNHTVEIELGDKKLTQLQKARMIY